MNKNIKKQVLIIKKTENPKKNKKNQKSIDQEFKNLKMV